MAHLDLWRESVALQAPAWDGLQDPLLLCQRLAQQLDSWQRAHLLLHAAETLRNLLQALTLPCSGLAVGVPLIMICSDHCYHSPRAAGHRLSSLPWQGQCCLPWLLCFAADDQSNVGMCSHIAGRAPSFSCRKEAAPACHS